MHGKTRTGLVAVAFTVVLAVFAAPIPAQDKPADTMQIVRDKLRADKRLFIAEHLPLTESAGFWPMYDSYQGELSTLNDRMIRLIKEYASHYQTMSDHVAKRLVDDYLAIEAERLKLRQTYLPKFRKVLGEKLVTRYYQLENKVQAAVNYELAAEIPLVK